MNADNIINKNYQIEAHMSYDIKNGILKQPLVKHSDHFDYAFSREDAIRARLRYLRSQKKELEKDLTFFTNDWFNQPNWFSEQNFLDSQRAVNKVNKDIQFNLNRMKYQEDAQRGYSIADIKQIPISSITRIHNNGFFDINPFRVETVPSDSLHWDKKTNRFTDFGSGQHGDIIDAYQAIYQCDLKTALKELDKLL